MGMADALSRSLELNSITKEETLERKILNIHKKLNHRMTIKNDLEILGIKVSTQELNECLQKCEVCKKMNKVYYKTAKHIESFYPGERVAIDILEINITLHRVLYSQAIWKTVKKKRCRENFKSNR